MSKIGKLFVFSFIIFFINQTGVFGNQTNDLSIKGFVDSSFSYNRNDSSNSFSLDQIEIDITKKIEGKGSLNLDLQFINGEIKDTDDILEQGYLTMENPIKEGGGITFGKFNAPLGFEYLDAPNMYQYSHSLVFDYGLPTNLTGLMFSTSFIDKIDLGIYIVNGWDLITDNDSNKSFGGRIGVTPIKDVNFGISAIVGPEKNDYGNNSRKVIDIDSTITSVFDFTIGLELNLGWENKASKVNLGGDASWLGGLVMIHYDYTSWGGITFRYDYFDDKDGARIGEKVKRQAITLSPTFVIADGFGALIEYRHDIADSEFFTKTDATKTDGNDTVAFEMTYSF